jgi:predicted DNA-binding protein (MmcQ/YjbR family)
MTDMDALFERRKLVPERLFPFGFVEKGNAHTYSASLLGGQFEMTVTVTREGKVSAEVFDASSREPYVLHRIHDATGPFVGAVREGCTGVLSAISETCFEPDVFKSAEARRVIEYVREKYQDELQFLWRRFPDNAIFRRKDNRKWYAALLVLQKRKLGLDEDGTVDILDLRGRPEDIAGLLDGAKYFPGFHMNKKHWFTLCLDGSVPMDEVLSRIDESFALAGK